MIFWNEFLIRFFFYTKLLVASKLSNLCKIIHILSIFVNCIWHFKFVTLPNTQLYSCYSGHHTYFSLQWEGLIFGIKDHNRAHECQRIDAFELWCWRRLLTVPWITQRSKPVNPKGNQSWIFIRTDVEAETPKLRQPVSKRQLIRKDPDAEKNQRQEEEGMTEDKMIG